MTAILLRSQLPRILAVCLLVAQLCAHAQAPLRLSGTVEDTSGRPVPSAKIVATGSHGEVTANSNSSGHFDLNYPASTATIQATTHLMESTVLHLSAQTAATSITLILHPSSATEQITVTATRSSIEVPATAHTIYALSTRDLNNFPAIALDDKLRQQAGFELFRRSSSHIQNPTSQGISLRGLGSTAASRTLVVQNNVPLNDPFGGWIHWNEIPSAAIEAVTIATGGGSDLYGSSALGGVIDVIPAHPSTTTTANISAIGGGQDTSYLSARVDLGNTRWQQLFAADSYRTAGYIPTAPSLTGPVDVPANVHYQSVRAETDRTYPASNRAFLIGNMLNEAHGNGTPIQTNATRLWRYVAADTWSAGSHTSGRASLFGSDEHYRQSFSAINAARSSENLTRRQRIRAQELGVSTDAAFALPSLALVAGVDVRDIRATDDETPITSNKPNGIANTTSRQRFVGGFGEALATHRVWSAALSLRLDSVSNLDTRSLSASASAPEISTTTPNRSEFIASPRLGIVRQIAPNANIHASVFRAFRTPTMNELYRTGQVGQEITQANPELLSERATGWEIGSTFASPSNSITLAGTYFWTQINRPVSAVFVSSTPTSILNKRLNLGQIVSQGTELHLDLQPRHTLFATVGYQYAHATVTRYSAQSALVGNWIPEVPRHSVTAQLRAEHPGIGQLTLAARASGHAYDDSANTYVLHSFFSLDLSARHDFGPHWTASLMIDNLLNQRPDVARTPTLTLGSPLLAQGGLSFHWNAATAH
jgi:outer membrane receptor protein involved in Fe transport